jgi:hypothetical protein
MSDAKLYFWPGRQKKITEMPVSEDERIGFITLSDNSFTKINDSLTITFPFFLR